MLAALMLLGLVPLAFLSGDEDDYDTAEDQAPEATDTGDGTDTGTDLLDSGTEDAGDADADSGDTTDADDARVFEPETGAGEYDYNDFRAGTDRVQIDLTGESGDLEIGTSTTDTGSSLTVNTSSGPMTLNFSGLDSVPAGDIDLVVTDPETGETETVTLEELLASAEEDGGDGLDPMDPDATDDWQGTGNGEAGTDPVDPDQTGEAGGGEGEAGMDPLGPDGEPQSGDDGDSGDPAVGELLARAMERDSDATAGLDAALESVDDPGSTATELGSGDDTFSLDDDGSEGTGSGDLTMYQTTPAVGDDDGVAVVDGGDGDDTLTGGDGAAYLFGGDGADTITSGEGATAAFGGAGDDSIDASASEGSAWLDGGSGDDTLTGGDGDDVIEGGSHGLYPDGSDADRLDGGEGDDRLRGGHGADTLFGGDGDDVIDHHGRLEEREEEVRYVFSDHIDDADDTLYGGAGNDTLIMDGGDTAEGGEGEDYFWVFHDGANGDMGSAEITDFEVGTDFLHISLNPDLGEEQAWDVTVEPSPDGQDGHVYVNGDLVAVLRGASDATEADVYVEVKADVFA